MSHTIKFFSCHFLFCMSSQLVMCPSKLEYFPDPVLFLPLVFKLAFVVAFLAFHGNPKLFPPMASSLAYFLRFFLSSPGRFGISFCFNWTFFPQARVFIQRSFPIIACLSEVLLFSSPLTVFPRNSSFFQHTPNYYSRTGFDFPLPLGPPQMFRPHSL